jgi:hypothetical protein
MLREAVDVDQPLLPPLTNLILGTLVPELLPTIAALIVLRRRPIGWCADGCLLWSRQGASWCCCLPSRRIAGIDMSPLRDSESGWDR